MIYIICFTDNSESPTFRAFCIEYIILFTIVLYRGTQFKTKLHNKDNLNARRKITVIYY